MKTEDAKKLIAQLIEQGKTNEEIIEVVKSQDGKIGNKTATDDIIAQLIEQAGNEDPGTPGCNYEKWKCSYEIGSDKKPIVTKEKKLRDIRLTDLQAEILNSANATGRGYCIRYFKK